MMLYVYWWFSNLSSSILWLKKNYRRVKPTILLDSGRSGLGETNTPWEGPDSAHAIMPLVARWNVLGLGPMEYKRDLADPNEPEHEWSEYSGNCVDQLLVSTQVSVD